MDDIDIKLKWIEPKKIELIAKNFLIKYWDDSIPVDIEKITEIKLKIGIIPIANLPKIAFLRNDMKAINVDYKHYFDERFFYKYKFAIAHEVGHYILHKYIYEKIRYNSIEQFYDFINNFNDNFYSKFEWQANQFAGNILVPKDRLVEEYFKLFNNNKKLIEEMKTNPEFAILDIKNNLSKIFQVSDWVIGRRIIDGEIDYNSGEFF